MGIMNIGLVTMMKSTMYFILKENDKNLVDEILYDVAKNASGMYNMSHMSLLYNINGRKGMRNIKE